MCTRTCGQVCCRVGTTAGSAVAACTAAARAAACSAVSALPAAHCIRSLRCLLQLVVPRHTPQIDSAANYKSFTEDWIALHSRDAKSPLQRPAILKEFGANVGGARGGVYVCYQQQPG